MRRRNIQSLSVKLNDLKEYDQMKQEKAQKYEASGPAIVQSQPTQPLLTKIGPKSKQEIRERLGLPID